MSNQPSDLLNSLLDSTIAEIHGSQDTSSLSATAAAGVRKANYFQLVAFQNVSSYSTQSLLHDCPRKFQLTKMRADAKVVLEEEDDETATPGNPDFAFGHAVGAGVAVFDESGDMDRALLACFLSWDIDLLYDPVEHAKRTGKKLKLNGFYHALWAILCYQRFVEEETDLSEYEFIQAEATIAVDFENGHYYSGHIDELLRHKRTGAIRVKENKTDGAISIDPAKYSNSDQALSYSVVVSVHGATEYEVFYTIYCKPEKRWVQMSFVKSPLSALEWLQGQAMLTSQIDMYADANFFPKNGHSCFKYSYRCPFYEDCDVSSARMFGKRFSELATVRSFEDLDLIEKVDYRVTWSEIVETQKRLAGKQRSSSSTDNATLTEM
jgi:PD-(D/E)XK nuclease superfamily